VQRSTCQLSNRKAQARRIRLKLRGWRGAKGAGKPTHSKRFANLFLGVLVAKRFGVRPGLPRLLSVVPYGSEGIGIAVILRSSQ